MIETERLKIYAASQDIMERFIEAQTVDVLKAAYIEMLNGCLMHPDQWDWYAIWMIELKDGTHIGELCFKGLSVNGIAEIGYGISEEYQNNGYATEAVKAVLEWAFSHPEVIAIEAETESENAASFDAAFCFGQCVISFRDFQSPGRGGEKKGAGAFRARGAGKQSECLPCPAIWRPDAAGGYRKGFGGRSQNSAL